MESLYLIVPVSIIVFGLAVALFVWSVDDGQYDDLEGEAGRILYDEDDEAMAEAGTRTDGDDEPGTKPSPGQDGETAADHGDRRL